MQHAFVNIYEVKRKINDVFWENNTKVGAKFREEVLDCTVVGTSFSMTFSIISTVLTFS